MPRRPLVIEGTLELQEMSRASGDPSMGGSSTHQLVVKKLVNLSHFQAPEWISVRICRQIHNFVHLVAKCVSYNGSKLIRYLREEYNIVEITEITKSAALAKT